MNKIIHIKKRIIENVKKYRRKDKNESLTIEDEDKPKVGIIEIPRDAIGFLFLRYNFNYWDDDFLIRLVLFSKSYEVLNEIDFESDGSFYIPNSGIFRIEDTNFYDFYADDVFNLDLKEKEKEKEKEAKWIYQI